jgi:hypothetical protein
MSDSTRAYALIDRLTGDLRPVRALPSPWRRTANWCGAVALAVCAVAPFTDFNALAHRLAAAPDMWLALLGALLTCVAAAAAAFATSVPGRPVWWAALPLPPLTLWVGASTAGCLRPALSGWTMPEPHMHPMHCMYFIVAVSLPLAGLLGWQITRACPLRPALTASLAGLASAGGACVVLALIHPFDASYSDLLAHLAAVLLVIIGANVVGGRTQFFFEKKNQKTFTP